MRLYDKKKQKTSNRFLLFFSAIMANLRNIYAIVKITLMNCFIYVCIHAYPTIKISVDPYEFNNIFYLGKHGLKLQVPKQTKCETIEIPICKNGVGYVKTFLPNIFKDRNQYQASLSLKQFQLLLDLDCSLDLRRFLCSLYLPICNLPFRTEPILPCHRLCSRVKKDCSHLLYSYGLSWPVELNCQNFPKSGLCIGPPVDSIEDNSTILKSVMDFFPRRFFIPDKKKQDIFKTSDVSPNVHMGLKNIKSCGRLCFEITYIISWIKVYSVLCFLSTSCTIFIFFSDMKRYLYPERTLIWMSSCYMVLSITYITECFFTKEQMALTFSETSNNDNISRVPEITLSSPPNITTITLWQKNSSNIPFHVQINNKDYDCTFYFIIRDTYMAAGCLWWTMTSVAYYLFVTHGQDFVKAISLRFHLLVCCGKFVFLIPHLILRFVYPLENYFCPLLTFLNTFLRLCCLFFFLLYKLKEWFQVQNTEARITRNHYKKLRLFSEVCTFTFLIVVLCEIFEFLEKDKLEDCTKVNNITHKACSHSYDRQIISHKVKYFMIFFPGIASGFCMISTTCKQKSQCSSNGKDNKEIEL